MSAAANEAPRVCAVVPTFDNPRTVGDVVERIAAHDLFVILVDDGSAEEGARACRAAAERPGVELVRREANGGKGAAVKDGLRRAAELGHTHAFQIDADGQHDTDAIPAFLEAVRADPTALVLGAPVYDASAPAQRTFARRFMLMWVGLETGRRDEVADAMIGFRVYPVQASLATRTRGDRMEFDVEILVRLLRAEVPVVNLPVRVRYLDAAEGGVSHFRMVRDNVRFSWLHCRLCTAMVLEAVFVAPWRRLVGGAR